MNDGVYAGPSRLATMIECVEIYCEAHGIDTDLDREAVARRIIDLHSQGITERDAMLAVLATQDAVTQTG